MAATTAASATLAVSNALFAKSDVSVNTLRVVSVPFAKFESSFSKLSLTSTRVNASTGNSFSLMISASSEVEEVETSSPSVPQGTKLYVGNLPFNVDSESLAEVFQTAGVVDLVEVIYDRDSGRSRGFAFVTMNTVQDAESAIEKLDGSELGGRSLRVNFPSLNRSPSTRPPRTENRTPRSASLRDSPNKLYIGNLSWAMDDYSLQELFSEFGKVLEAKVVMDRDTGRSRGFGFVTYSDLGEVNQAVSALDGAEVDGRIIRVSVANAREARPRDY